MKTPFLAAACALLCTSALAGAPKWSGNVETTPLIDLDAHDPLRGATWTSAAELMVAAPAGPIIEVDPAGAVSARSCSTGQMRRVGWMGSPLNLVLPGDIDRFRPAYGTSRADALAVVRLTRLAMEAAPTLPSCAVR